MRLTLEIKGADLPLGPGVTVNNAHSCGLIAFNKPDGIRSHPNTEKVDQRALLTCLYDLKQQYYSWVLPDGKEKKMYLLNRLDSPASGLIIGATTRELAEYVKNCFLNKKIDKLYHAIVFNSRLKINSPWRDTIKVTRKSGKLRSQVDSPQGDFALTHVRLSSSPSENSNCALIELRPVTGRTHQLRVQCAKRKFPIVGDSTYGDFRLNRELQKITGQQTALFACQSYSHSIGG